MNFDTVYRLESMAITQDICLLAIAQLGANPKRFKMSICASMYIVLTPLSD